MRGETIRTYKSVHTWTGIVAGWFLFVGFYAGAVSVFEPTLTRWAAAPTAAVLTPIYRADALIAKVQAELPDIAKHFTLNLDDGPEVAARLYAQPSRRDPAQVRVEMDADGTLHTTRAEAVEMGQFVDDLHRTAGVTTDVELGAMFMGVVSAVYVVALISGVIIILPSLVRDLMAMRMDENLKRMWMDAHNLVGVISLPFHVFIALTAVAFGLHDEIYSLLNTLVLDGNIARIMQTESPLAAVPRDPSPAIMLPVNELLARLRDFAPEFTPFSMEWRDVGTGGASVMIWGHDEHHLTRSRGFATMSAVTGAILNTNYLPGHQEGYGAAVSAFFALHFATFGGATVKWSYFLLGLAGAFLFYSGNLLWIESRRKLEKRAKGPNEGVAVEQSRSTRWMATATVGVCLGCVTGLSAAIAIGRWLPDGVEDPVGWWWVIYRATLVACVVWACIRGAARAGSELLWAAAIATAAIPATSPLIWVGAAPNASQAWDGDIAVGLVALVGAVGFALMARATARRAASAPHDSVWAYARNETVEAEPVPALNG